MLTPEWMHLRQQCILIQQILSCTSYWLPVMMTPPLPKPLLQSGPAGASWGWSQRWCGPFSSGIHRMSPWVWGRPVALQPWTQSHLFLQCPGRGRWEKSWNVSLSTAGDRISYFNLCPLRPLRREERLFPYLTTSLWSTNAPMATHMGRKTHTSVIVLGLRVGTACVKNVVDYAEICSTRNDFNHYLARQKHV